MAYYDRTFSSSPVLTMPLQSVRQVPFDMPVLSKPSSPFGQFGHPNSWNQLPFQQPVIFQRPNNVAAGRKRSRDEAAPNLDPPEKLVEPPVVEEEEESDDEWVFGPGMMLMKKSSNYVSDASSQSGTWVEEQASKDAAARLEAALLSRDRESQERPSLRNHKSQRLDMPQSASLQDRSSPSRDLANPDGVPTDSTQPIVDDFTLHLGIGWNRISSDIDIQAAARGWARYIENHFPVTDVKILLESRGLQSYLVETKEGFFLFAENLRQGRLVSQNAERALQNLKVSPPVFDSLDTLEACGTPKPLESSTPEPESGDTAATASVEMDMS